jgi:ELWxxDGT repeat protein
MVFMRARRALYATAIVDVNGTLFFGVDDGEHGSELWKSDGASAGTMLVKDIAPDSPARTRSHS